MNLLSGGRGFIVGFLVASVLFGGLAAGAADILQKDIRVSYLPLKYMFNGQEKTPPADQPGFTFNGRTFVSLRFAADSLGRKVDYDPQTYTVYIGAKPAPVPAIWAPARTDGKAIIRPEYFPSDYPTIVGEPMPNALILNAMSLANFPEAEKEGKTYYIREFTRDPNHSRLRATLFIPESYFGTLEDQKLGYMLVMDENNQRLFISDELTSQTPKIPIDVPIGATTKQIKVFFVMYHNYGLTQGDGMLLTRIGVSDFRFE